MRVVPVPDTQHQIDLRRVVLQWRATVICGESRDVIRAEHSLIQDQHHSGRYVHVYSHLIADGLNGIGRDVSNGHLDGRVAWTVSGRHSTLSGLDATLYQCCVGVGYVRIDRAGNWPLACIVNVNEILNDIPGRGQAVPVDVHHIIVFAGLEA